MNTECVQVLVNPGRFFKERMKDEPGLKIPMLITLVYGLISAVSAALAVNMIIALLPAEAQTPGVMMKLMVAVAAAATAIITAYLTWFAVGIIFHLLSMLFKGEGSLKRTLEVTGYGLLPQVFGGIIGAVFSYQVISNLTIPSITNPEQITEALESLTALIVADPLTQIAGLLGILFILWSANIWIFGLKYARNLSTRDAVLTVGIPVGLYLAYQIYTLITLAGWI
ncbi:MAG: Yip1 family protein [Candidatus Methanoculleus thermohydrogenotrophicum]